MTTRQQICAAANDLFVRSSYGAATMEEIARAAGIRRSTLYTHFADKEQILSAIGEDYVIDVCAVIRRLQGPVPSAAAVAAWVDEFADFVSRRPGPAELVTAVGRQVHTPQASRDFGAAMIRCFAEQIIAFAKALGPGEGFRLAWALATISELAAAVLHRAAHGDAQLTRDRLAVASMLLTRFCREER